MYTRIMTMTTYDANETRQYPSYLLSTKDVPPSAGRIGLGVHLNDQQVRYNYPPIFAIMFPYLYTEGVGYFTMGFTSQTSPSLT